MSWTLKIFYILIIIGITASILVMHQKFLLDKNFVFFTNEESVPNPLDIIKSDWTNFITKHG